MLTNPYQRGLAGFGILLLLLIAVLSFALYNQGPRIRMVSFSGDIGQASLTDGIVMSLNFDRRINRSNYAQNIRITPQVDASYVVGEKDILIRFEENLRHNTTYTLEVDPVIIDDSGKVMRESFVYQFTTASADYAYIERNYDESADQFDTADDFIYIASDDGKRRQIFSHPRIRSFAANNRYLVIVVQEVDEDNLYTIDLLNNDQRQESIRFGGRLDNLAISQFGNIALLTIEPDIKSVSESYFNTYSDQVESLDLTNGNFRTLRSENGESIKATSIWIDQGGQLALIQTPELVFEAISPYNDYEPVIIGSYSDTYGTFNNGSELVFRDQQRFVRYSIEGLLFIPINWGFDEIIRDVAIGNGENVFVSTLAGPSKNSNARIYRAKGFNDPNPNIAWESTQNKDNSVASFSVSYDDSRFAVTEMSRSCRFDAIGINSQCTDIKTKIINASTQEIIDEFSGFDLVWLP